MLKKIGKAITVWYIRKYVMCKECISANCSCRIKIALKDILEL